MFPARLYAGRLFSGRLYRRSSVPAQPEFSAPSSNGGRSQPQRDARRPRNDDDELLLLVLL